MEIRCFPPSFSFIVSPKRSHGILDGSTHAVSPYHRYHIQVAIRRVVRATHRMTIVVTVLPTMTDHTDPLVAITRIVIIALRRNRDSRSRRSDSSEEDSDRYGRKTSSSKRDDSVEYERSKSAKRYRRWSCLLRRKGKGVVWMSHCCGNWNQEPSGSFKQ